ncbi:hypothetical protein EDD79_10723 [Serpentinicella alkaliphila]|uniref:Uncharacterized protein n=1 Tax=Serpentinicella alkaliphila TaxID=1734049 RepID=A0A4R2SYI9_9FIRM|nr:hypothetical protein EDD79_10723 [Serpentinicella alkaliphila]
MIYIYMKYEAKPFRTGFFFLQNKTNIDNVMVTKYNQINNSE